MKSGLDAKHLRPVMTTSKQRRGKLTKALIIGQGAREHAFGWKLAQEGIDLYFGSGNPGTRSLGYNVSSIATQSDNVDRDVIRFSREEQIDLVLVTDEDLLGKGLVNKLVRAGVLTFGATIKASKIEWSKVWANRFLDLYGIPHARGVEITSPNFGLVLPENFRVVKADGLARGKGVRIAPTVDQVQEAINKLQIAFPRAAERILIQEYLEGREVSAQAFTDGSRLLMLPFSVDHKRFGEDDSGDNSGGLASYSDVPWLMNETHSEIEKTILEKLIYFLRLNGIDFRGVIYGGLKITKDGPKLIEVNARPGDPETQAILPRLQSKLLPVLQQVAAGKLEVTSLDWDSRVAVCVVLCSEGYPDEPKVGRVIHGLNDLPKDILVFHAGTALNDKRELITSGGRVLSIVALGETLEAASSKVYEAIERIKFEGMHFLPKSFLKL